VVESKVGLNTGEGGTILTAKIPPANNQAGIGTTKNSRNWVFGNIAAKKAGCQHRDRERDELSISCITITRGSEGNA
jgi:hypothetical protein